MVLEWNDPALKFYESLGAELLGEWETMLLRGEPLQRLAGVAPQRFACESRTFGTVHGDSDESWRPQSVTTKIKIIGAGLAGCEAAWQCARRGVEVELYEMRPVKSTPAHQTDKFAELVCSNSLKSESENTAPWLLKEEMRRVDSLLLRVAKETSVPAGHALAVDRETFAAKVTEAISAERSIKVVRQEVAHISEADGLTIVATGPLTSDALSLEIARLSGSDHLFFYDSISPIVEADSIDMSKVYMAARYGKGTADYINCPFTKEEYDRFIDALTSAEMVEGHDWENLNYFEGCLPIEEIARRGRDTLRFGP